MRKNITQEAAGFLARARQRRIWLKVVSALGCVVVFCTTYALILPAITLEKTGCGLTEHTHTTDCYTQITAVTRQEPVCSLEKLELHEHTEDCFDENGEPVCGYADFVVHEHDASCYDEDGQLWCPLPEIQTHTHTDSCYAVSGGDAEPAHVHTEDCYTLRKGGLTCTTPESQGHTHDDACYTEVTTLVCTTPESDGHQHGADCYDGEGNLTCDLAESEGHHHGESCYEVTRELTCQLAEEAGHQHTDDCYAWEKVLTCEQSTEPVAAEPELVCGKEEIILHEHEDTCFDENDNLICGKTQVLEHVHSDACFETVEQPVDTEALTCGLTEGEGAHTHDDSCWNENGELICQLEESAGHQHTELCYGTWELTCGLEEHQHDETCMAGGIATADEVTIPPEILEKLAGQGIYPGTKEEATDGSTVWTVQNVAGEGSATIKATVTLSEAGREGYYLYLTAAKAPDDLVGDATEVQCYDIRWVHVYQNEDSNWLYDEETEALDTPVTVQIEYQNGAGLKGSNAQRKLLVYSSGSDSDTLTEAELTAVTANDTAYTGFTFRTESGGPFVFVSKTVAKGYVHSLEVNNIIDGVSPFDSDDKPGNDSSADNRKVRSYDTVEYNLGYNIGARSSTATGTTVDVCYEFTLDADITQAVFQTSSMGWMTTAGSYTYEYLDKDGNVVLTQKDGKYYDAAGQEKTLNDIATGSTQGMSSYTTDIVKQRLSGTVTVTDDENVLSSEQKLAATIQVLNAANESTIQPEFRVWIADNEDNYGSESGSGGNDVVPAEKVTTNQCKPASVRVSATARFNLELAKSGNVNYKSWFDSSKDHEVSKAGSYTVGTKEVTGQQLYDLLEALGTLPENQDKSDPRKFTDEGGACSAYLQGLSLSDYQPVFEHIRYGRITGYGVTLEVYNPVNPDGSSKGFKGVSLPQDDITFALALETTVGVGGGAAKTDEDYYAQLWEYNENVSENKGNQGKNLYWANLDSTKYASWAASYNNGTGAANCYQGGAWKLDQRNGDGSYSFTVSGYDLNLLAQGLQFPTHRAGNSSATTGYNDYIGGFSAGFIQVLNVFPRTQSQDCSVYTDVTVKDLTVNTTTGATIRPEPEDATGYGHESNTGDNSIHDMIPLYSPGGMTKANAFCNAKCFTDYNADFTGSNYFLGSNFWTTGYDASAFAGQDITLVGAARINAGDYAIKHMNMLQLFDSAALSIDSSKQPFVLTRVSASNEGETTILYAADPKYKDGYDTNQEGVQKRMNAVREEDLIYYTSLAVLEGDGYTCVGVLAELRNCTIYGEGGYSTALKIPMKVSQEEKFVNKTVCTMNSVRIWTNAADMGSGTVTWANGKYDSESGKNQVDGYTKVPQSGEHYCGEVANSGNTEYVKAEYTNNQVVVGTNSGGYVSGATLLILGYKSTIAINVDNGGTTEGSLPQYEMDRNQTLVNYRLSGIQAKVDNTAGTPQSTSTNLTVRAALDTANTTGKTRITVASDGYQMKAASELMQLVSQPDGNGEVLDSVEISTDPGRPTTVYYKTTENLNPPAGQEIKWTYHTIQVYAQPAADGKEITFELSGVTVGVSVPDITFDGLIDPTQVENNDRIEAQAYIGGTSDVRAYAETYGNMDVITIGIIRLGSTRLVKAVDTRYIELDGTITYTVTYTNSGTNKIGFYLYDLLPDPEDKRGTHYQGSLVLQSVKAMLGSGDGLGSTTVVLYSSTLSYEELNTKVEGFSRGQAELVDAMLTDSGTFAPAGKLTGSNNSITISQKKTTGIYAVVHDLEGGQSLSIQLTVKTNGNQAGDLYRNVAYAWRGDSSAPLTSNMVETMTLSRTISGVVWHDANLDGVRDGTESLISDVTCTLFRWDETANRYVRCDRDVTGAAIKLVTTGEDGAYRFEKLAAGEYIVAFSGDGLDKYTGATTYQVNGINDSATNDAVALTSTGSEIDTEYSSFSGIDNSTYRYAIAYSLKDSVASAVSLHTIPKIIEGNITLTNGVELYTNQDCGLVLFAGYELPQTGGAGTTLYTIGGLLILVGTGFLLLYSHTKHRRGGFSL